MKIGIVKPTASIAPTGGVKVQGLMWRDGLVTLGHEVILVDFWQNYDWESFDWIIVLQFGGMFTGVSSGLRKHCKRIACAPIIDPKWNHSIYKFYTKYWGFHKHLGLTSRFHEMYRNRGCFDLWLVRSEYEASYVEKCLDIDRKLIRIVPLQVRVPFVDTMPVKENFCFHASRLFGPNKNVPRLIKAAKKYNFKLVLAGYLHGEKEKKWLKDQICGFDNIEYVGTLSEEDLLQYYRRCKVFALPSTQDGVGMVALEAAANGAEVVLTKLGAPKDYFQGRAQLVDPFSIDEIGYAITELMDKGKSQPELVDFMKKNYTPEVCAKQLEKALMDFI